MAKIDLKDAYLTAPMHPSTAKYLCFQWKRTVYKFTSLPFGLALAPLHGFHEVDEACCFPTEEMGYSDSFVPGRYAHHGQVSRASQAALASDNNPSGSIRFHPKPQKVCYISNTNHGVSGISHELHWHDTVTPFGESEQIAEEMQTHNQPEVSIRSP